MTTEVCPYLGAAGDIEVYVPEPGQGNRCYSASDEDPATVSPRFQADHCLTDQYQACSRYQAAREPLGLLSRVRPEFLLLGGMLALLVLGGCFFLTLVALGGSLGAFQGAEAPTATAILLPSPMPSPTPSPTLTASATPLPTATPSPSPSPLPTQTATPLPTQTQAWTATPSVPGSPTLPATATRAPTATRKRPTATKRRPTATRKPVRTSTPTRTRTPTPTRTPTGSPTPSGCYGDETMTFDPAAPGIGEEVIIEVRSKRGHTDIALSGPDQPHWDSVDNDGTYYYWRWRITYSTAGSRTYSFTINGGALTCETGTVTVSGATETPTATATNTPTATDTPTPTPTDTSEPPSYGVSISGESYKEIPPGGTAEFNATMLNNGNVEDTFELGLNAAPPTGWEARFCIGSTCYQAGVTQNVTVSAGGSQALSVKLISPAGAADGQQVPARLWATSQSDGSATASLDVTAKVVVVP